MQLRSKTNARRLWGTFLAIVLFAAETTSTLLAQPPATLESTSRRSQKPAVASAGISRSTEALSGNTYVALAGGLERVFSGLEPQSLTELKLLEVQQSKVAETIEKVTVNVQQGSAQGSGVIINSDGYVLTAAHVAGKPDLSATVVFSDGRRFAARTLGMNRDKDAGLLKIIDKPGEPWPHATPGQVGLGGKSSEDALREGQWCIAAGHPGGWQSGRGAVIRVGRILMIDRSRDGKPHTLFTDCALIGGDSGGPLFTLEGKLIGVHSRIGTEVTDNMHVPVDVFRDSWERLAKGEAWGVLPGYRPVIGVRGAKGADRPLIAHVAPRGPAARAGLQAGDEVLSINGVSITTFSELQMAVEASMPGEVLTLQVQRQDQRLRLSVTVGVAEQ